MEIGTNFMKKVLSITLVSLCFNACAALRAAGGTFLFLDTVDETIDSDEKISVLLENRTDEMLAVFVLFLDKKTRGAELARISAHSVKELRVTPGRALGILGGQSGISYRDIECNYEGECFIIYPQFPPSFSVKRSR